MRTCGLSSFMFVLAMCFAAGSSTAAECSRVWENAQRVMAQDCNDTIATNTMCYAHDPLKVDPPYDRFKVAGDMEPITTDLKSIEALAGGEVGGFSFLKVLTGDRVQNVPFGQSIILIAFGNSALRQIKNRSQMINIEEGDRCSASVVRGSTSFGGTYIRALPDPSFRIECATSPCDDKNNLLYFVQEGESIGVKGRNSAGDAVLVHNDHATGWVTSSSRYVDLSDCNFDQLPVFHDSVIVDLLQRTVASPVATEFRLENVPSAESQQCTNEDRPPGGLLILNSSDQKLVFSINSLEIVLASSVFIGSAGGITYVFVLHGNVTVTTADRRSQRASSGQVIVVQAGDRPRLTRAQGGRVSWCNALNKLAAAAYTVRGSLRIPEARLNFCRHAGGGYPIGFRRNTDNPNSGGLIEQLR
ncbi:MAG: hypothetical protein GY948_06735 [Alphaproteobacteria bacterium]|nr:hypothetical protein [Alphaproteobacteria bacterium]